MANQDGLGPRALCYGHKEVSKGPCRQSSSGVSATKGCGFLLKGNGRFAKHLSICILLIFLLQEEGKRFLGLLTVPYLSAFFRLNPKNVHQRPTVALLCGPHVKGAQGISCGRHLSNHDVHIILFLPNFVKMLESITNELNLFSKTQGQQVSSVRGKQARSRPALLAETCAAQLPSASQSGGTI